MSAQFNNPRGIAVGNIIVADTGNRAIREVASNGSVKTLVLYDEKGRKFEGFKEPTDVAVDAEGRIVVADSKARRLWVIENGVAGRPKERTVHPSVWP
jgi:sugar lactone lactonase YvrE